MQALTDEQAEALRFDWEFWARDKQLPPAGNWGVWLYMAGRGAGKTRTAAEWIKRRESEGYRRFAFVGQTPADVRDVMIEGESGILNVYPEGKRPIYEPTKRRVTWPSGAMAITYSGANPEQLRGPQHDSVWVDELAAFKYPRETWDNLSLGLRLGADPRAVITTTPKPLSILREIRDDSHTVTITENTYANRLNVSEMFFRTVVARYEGTRTGRQEIYAELLDEAEGALWKRNMFESLRVKVAPMARRLVVAIDPAASHTQDSNETGILVVMIGVNGHGYVLEDRSGRYSPAEWAGRAINALDVHRADRIVAEDNNGGEMVEDVVRTRRPSAPIKRIHASRSKQARAEPVVALYEQGLIHHVGMFPELEDQLVSWEPLSGDPSPDRLDALVWGFTELMLGAGFNVFV